MTVGGPSQSLLLKCSTARIDSYIFKNNVKKTYRFLTQCKGVICHPFKTEKIIVSPHEVQKSKSALTRRAVVLISFVVHVIQ